VALPVSFRGKDRAEQSDFESLRYSKLEARLELLFGERYMAQTFNMQFTNYRQKFGEDLPTLGMERLMHLAYSECSLKVRDKIASVQFVVAQSDN